jgi:hypothetical protein
MSRKTLILLAQGGAGDILSFTPCIRAARKQYPDDEIVVLSTYAQLLDGNPNADVVIPLKDADKIGDFYGEYVLKRDVRFFRKFFPYDHFLSEARYNSSNLRDFITRLYGFEPDGSSFPDYFATDYEKRAADVLIRQDKKPVVLLHIFTAVPSENGMPQKMACNVCQGHGKDQAGNACGVCYGNGWLIQRQKTNALKDINPATIAPIVEKYKKDYNFLQIGLEGEPLIPGAFDCLGMPMRDTIAMIQHPQVKSFIFAESLFHHCAAAFRKPGVVVFNNTDPNFFGYSSAFNVWGGEKCDMWPCNRPVGALLDFNPGYKNPKTRERLLWECPDQKCAKLEVEKLEKVFVESITNKPLGGSAATIAEAEKL